MKSIISFFMAIFLAIQGFFGLSSGKGDISVTKLDKTTSFYCDGASTDGLLSYGVEGNSNLFAPGKSIRVIIQCGKKLLYGTKAKVTLTSEQADLNKTGTFTFAKSEAQYAFTFSSDVNGIYTVRLKTSDAKSYSFTIGIVPENSIASSAFYYGIQPYITRAQCWGEAYRIPGRDEAGSIDAILDTAEYMGVNLVREDGIAWSGMQSSAYADLDFTTQDYLVKQVKARNMKYNWILGGGTTSWSVATAYKNSYDASTVWSYAPDEDMWEDYITKLAAHYAPDTDILWEIWNEPNWSFFTGTQDEYFTLLENTAKIIKQASSCAYVYSGGLAVAERDTNMPYFTKAAELIDAGLLDNWGYHNHDGNDTYCGNVNHMLQNARSAGLTTGGINSESGSYGLNASLIARKALYTRATGGAGFVSFSFRKSSNDAEVNNYAFFNEYLQPTEAVITYSTVIRFLGNAVLKGSKALADNVYRDEYRSGSHTVYVYYSFGTTAKTTLPDNISSAYDMYGNSLTVSKTLTVTENPVYVIV